MGFVGNGIGHGWDIGCRHARDVYKVRCKITCRSTLHGEIDWRLVRHIHYKCNAPCNIPMNHGARAYFFSHRYEKRLYG